MEGEVRNQLRVVDRYVLCLSNEDDSLVNSVQFLHKEQLRQLHLQEEFAEDPW